MFRLAAIILCVRVAFVALCAIMIRKRGHQVAAFLHRVTSVISANLAYHVDQKVRAFGEGLNTIASGKSFLKLVAISLLMWFLIALAYRQGGPSYTPAAGTGQEKSPPSMGVQAGELTELPGQAGKPLPPGT